MRPFLIGLVCAAGCASRHRATIPPPPPLNTAQGVTPPHDGGFPVSDASAPTEVAASPWPCEFSAEPASADASRPVATRRARFTCRTGAPESLVAWSRDGAAVTVFDASRPHEGAWLLELSSEGVARGVGLPRSVQRPRLAASDGRSLDLVGDDPVARRAVVMSAEAGAELRVGAPRPLPESGRIQLGAARRENGRLDVLVALGGASLPYPFTVLTRSAEGAWSSRPFGESYWPHAAIARGAADEALVARCATGRRPTETDLVVQVDEAAPRVLLRRAPCGDRQMVVASAGAPPVVAFRVGDVNLAAAGAGGAYARLVVERSREPQPLTCTTAPSPPLGLGPDTARCAAVSSGTSAFTLVRAGAHLWLVRLVHHVDRDLRIDRRCHPVDPVGPRIPPPHCEDALTPTADRSTAELVFARIDTSGTTARLVEGPRVTLGAFPPAGRALLAASAGEVVHIITRGAEHEGAYVAVDFGARR